MTSRKSSIAIMLVPKSWREVERVRRKIRFTMRELAEALGISHQAFYRRVNGKETGRYSAAFRALAREIESKYIKGSLEGVSHQNLVRKLRQTSSLE